MEVKNKSNLIVGTIVVLVVVGILFFFTFNSKNTQRDSLNRRDIDNVKITILSEGNGEIAKEGDIVSVNYTGRLEDGTVFDSNVVPEFNHMTPIQFTLGILPMQVIKGWDVGIKGMKVGEKRHLEIMPEYAYGPASRGNIPPNSKLIFDVELLAINK